MEILVRTQNFRQKIFFLKNYKSFVKYLRKRFQKYFQEWLDYEEIEDAEKRDRKFMDPEIDHLPGEEPEKSDEPEKVQTLPVSAGDNKCAVCRERFQTFFNQEDEEWHYGGPDESVVKDESSGKIGYLKMTILTKN